MSKASMRFGVLGQVERFGKIVQNLAGVRFHHAKPPFEGVPGISSDQFRQRALASLPAA